MTRDSLRRHERHRLRRAARSPPSLPPSLPHGGRRSLRGAPRRAEGKEPPRRAAEAAPHARCPPCPVPMPLTCPPRRTKGWWSRHSHRCPSRGRGGIESGRGSPSAPRRGGRGRRRRRKGGAGGEAALKAAVAAGGGGLTSGSKGPALSRVPRGRGKDPRGDKAPLCLVLGACWPWVRQLSVSGSVWHEVPQSVSNAWVQKHGHTQLHPSFSREKALMGQDRGCGTYCLQRCLICALQTRLCHLGSSVSVTARHPEESRGCALSLHYFHH